MSAATELISAATTGDFSDVSAAKLTASGLDVGYAAEIGVRPVASVDDLPVEFASMIGACPTPGMAFPWTHPATVETVWQYRPDHPVEEELKYLFAEGQHQPLGLVRAATTDNYRVAIVEGTLQARSFARYAPDNFAVYAIPGCWGWSHNKNATPDLVVVKDRDVIIFVDADAATNVQVYDGAAELARACLTYGALSAGFGRAPVRGTSGVDDFLGSVAEENRRDVVSNLADQIEQKPAARKPPGKSSKKTIYGLATAAGLPDVNDVFLGTSWADDHRDAFRWMTQDDTWMSYSAGRWSRCSATVVGSSVMERLNSVAMDYIAAAKREDGDKAERLEETGRMLLSNFKRGSVQATAANYHAIHVSRDELDQHPELFCMANATLDLATGAMREHDPDDLLTVGSDVDYEPGATCPRFDQFLAEVLPDAEVRAYLLRVFAMAMFGRVREHVLPVLVGNGRNGKGTLIKIMNAVFGEMSRTVEAKALMVTRYEAHTEEIARLLGKRLAVAEEPRKGAEWNSARINEWTGGNRLTGAFKGRDSIEFEPSHTLILVTNHRPTEKSGESDAFWARYKEIVFPACFLGRENYTLEPEIVGNELPGVLNRLIEAVRDYNRAGLAEPAAVTEASQSTQFKADTVAQFAEECLLRTDDWAGDRIPSPDVDKAYGDWCRDNGVASPVTRAAGVFAKDLRRALGWPLDDKNPKPTTITLSDGARKGVRLWLGLKWRDESAGNGAVDREIQALGRDYGSRCDYGSGPAGPAANRSEGLQGVHDQTTDTHDQTTENKINSKIRSQAKPLVSDVVTTETTETTDKCSYADSYAEKTQETHDDHENAGVFPVGGTANTGIRSHRSHRSQAAGPKINGQAAPAITAAPSLVGQTTNGQVAPPPSSVTQSEPNSPVGKVPCRRCQRLINSAGAARHGGLCGRCAGAVR